MHAAIIAYAYRTPFAFFKADNGYLDCPAKWTDWLSSITQLSLKASFFAHIKQGKDWYRNNNDLFVPQKLFPILKAYSHIGNIRTELAEKALPYDLQISLNSLNKTSIDLASVRHPHIDIEDTSFIKHFEHDVTKLTKNLSSIRMQLDKQAFTQSEKYLKLTMELKRSEAQIELLKELLL